MNMDKNMDTFNDLNVSLLKNFKGFYIPNISISNNVKNIEPLTYKDYVDIAIKYLKYGVYIPYKYLKDNNNISKDMLEILYDIAKDLYGVDFVSYNNGLFHKSLKKLLNCPTDTLVYEQLLNYMGRYNANTINGDNIVIAVPYETYDTDILKENEKNIKINVFKRLTKKDIFDRVSNLLSKNIGLSTDIKTDMFDILEYTNLLDKFCKEYLLKGLINNRETRYILYSHMDINDFKKYIIDSDNNISNEEIIRYIVYRIIGNTTIIKHDRGYRNINISRYSYYMSYDMLNILHDTLQSIDRDSRNGKDKDNNIALFRQYKDIFMLFKYLVKKYMRVDNPDIEDIKDFTTCKETINYINRLSKLSRNRKESHKGILNKFFVQDSHGQLSLSSNVTFRDYMEILNILYDSKDNILNDNDKIRIFNDMKDNILNAESYMIYQLIALYNSFNYYLVGCFKDFKNVENAYHYLTDGDSEKSRDSSKEEYNINIPYVYRIRNGKMFIKNKTLSVNKVYSLSQGFLILLEALKEKISDIVLPNIENLYINRDKNNNKKPIFVLDKDIRLAIPTTNKSFVSHIPMGSYINLHSNKGVIAIHWKNVQNKKSNYEYHWDIDLHLRDLSGDISYGWNTNWNSRRLWDSINLKFRDNKYFVGDSPYNYLLNKYYSEDIDSESVEDSGEYIIFTGDCTSAPLPYGATEAFIIGTKNNNINAYRVDIHDYSNYINNISDYSYNPETARFNPNDFRYDLIICNADNIDLNSIPLNYNGRPRMSLEYKDKPMICPNKDKDYTVIHSLDFKDGQDLNVGYLLKDNTNNLSFVFTSMVFDTIPTNTLKSGNSSGKDLNHYIIQYLINTVKSRLYLDTLLTDILSMPVVYKGSKEYKDIVNVGGSESKDSRSSKEEYNIIDLTVDSISKDTLLNLIG